MNPFFRNGDLSDLAIYLIGMACVGAVLLVIGVAA
jgi:hypothetical protein